MTRRQRQTKCFEDEPHPATQHKQKVKARYESHVMTQNEKDRMKIQCGWKNESQDVEEMVVQSVVNMRVIFSRTCTRSVKSFAGLPQVKQFELDVFSVAVGTSHFQRGHDVIRSWLNKGDGVLPEPDGSKTFKNPGYVETPTTCGKDRDEAQ